MTPSLRSTLMRLLALATLAGALAVIANALAPPARRLAWSGRGVATPTVAALAARPVPTEPSRQPPPPDAPAKLEPPVRPIAPASPRTPTQPPAATPEPPASSPIREVSSAEAWKAFQSGLPFLDARRSAEYTEGHVARAFCVPVWEADLEDRLITFKATRHPGPEDPIVIYCSGGDCKDSHLLATKLLNEGYFHLLIYRDGFPDWVGQKRPVEKGQP